MLLVALDEPFRQQRRSESLAVEVGFNADRRQVPMRIAWMIGRHLAKYGIRIRLDVGRHALLQNSGARILVRLRPGLPFLPRCRHPREDSDDAKQSLTQREITRIAVAFEAGHVGFWLARWLEARGVEAHVIHPSSVAVSREHRRAKTDRLDTELLKRGFLGWLRGERGHCSMARVPTIAEEDAKRPNRERECLVKERTRLVNRMKGTLARLGIRNFRPTLRNAAEHLAALSTPEGSPLPPNVAAELERDIERLRLVISQIKQLEEVRRQRLEEQPERGPHAMVRLLARVVGIGIETADMLVNEVLSRPLRDRRAVARYAGLTGAPDESGAKRREQGLGWVIMDFTPIAVPCQGRLVRCRNSRTYNGTSSPAPVP